MLGRITELIVEYPIRLSEEAEKEMMINFYSERDECVDRIDSESMIALSDNRKVVQINSQGLKQCLHIKKWVTDQYWED